LPLPGPVRWIIKGSLGLIVLLLIVVAVLAFIPIPIDLTAHKGLMEKIVAETIERDVRIDEKVQVTTSLWPSFTIKGLSIGNPEKFMSGEFARMQSALVQIGVVPLLLGKIHVDDFSVEGLHLFLRADDKGHVNWTFQAASSDVPVTPDKDKPATKEQEAQFKSDVLVVRKIDLNDISLSYQDPEMAKPFEFRIDKCNGSAKVGKPLQLDMEGSFLRESFTVSMSAASLHELIEENKSWMEIETEIAHSRFKLTGSVDLARIRDTLQLSAEVEGERLESFNRMLQLDLPPFPNYGAKATLSLFEEKIDLTDLRIHVGNSELLGKMTVDGTGSRPVADIDLKSPLIQVNDFIFDDWSALDELADESGADGTEKIKPGEGREEETKEVKEAPQADNKRIELLSPEFLGRFDFRLSVSADKVLYEEDQLGSGRIVATLEKGRISIDPLNLDLPGGPLLFAMSVKPGEETSDAAVRLKVGKQL
jgi:hypothetical protein